ncbi:hypothetical protein [Shimia sp. SDUM112013]|uniref:antibiotic biosynthesis monooxygenase family protein n=1 Tax=Shimia sp. SDUM112013 TaxID=3136160 RepID=UPI0032EC8657
MYYVAVGAAKMRHWWHYPEFFWRASAALKQAKTARGCVVAKTVPALGHYFSITVWESPAHMKAYVTSGAHRGALKMGPKLTESSVFHGFWSETIPSVSVALRAWTQAARHIEPSAMQNPVAKPVDHT